MEPEKNIFDLIFISDIEDKIIEKLGLNRHRSYSLRKRIYFLFSLKNELSINEIMIALYRQYKCIPSRNSVYITLGNMVRKKKLIKVDIGLYKLSGENIN